MPSSPGRACPLGGFRAYRGYIGVMCYMGIMEKKMETTI